LKRLRIRPARRQFFRLCAACATAFGALASGCGSLVKSRDRTSTAETLRCAPANADREFDYVVVGSGAGGGPLAANLALAGFKVLLLEAGGDEQSYEYAVPAFHALASEDPRFAWNFFVRHYSDDARQQRDPKYKAEQKGVLYPRCATLGGCTAHNAMILVYPHNSDWDYIAELTGDASWNGENMRRYFERLERCEYLVAPGSRHGVEGWLSTNVPDPLLIARDGLVKRLLVETVFESLGTLQGWFDRLWGRLRDGVDPNSWKFTQEKGEGLCMMPLTTHAGRRVGSREYILRVQAACPERLFVKTRALATRVLFDDDRRAIGVEYLSGEHLYRADPRFTAHTSPQPFTVKATREVILCAGAFNTPQLLKLSGVGPRKELERLGIPVTIDRGGVGENLQDRYEISVVTQMKHEFELMQGMRLRPPLPGEEADAPFREWLEGRGPYTTNGAVISMVKRSAQSLPDPDLYIFALLGSFEGYYPGYSSQIAQYRDRFTWAILKANTRNAAGTVTLRSGDPRDTPDIDFRYFEGTGADDDLEAVVDGVETVRSINRRCADIIEKEIAPGDDVRTREEIRQYIRDHAWGHHACGTSKMGPASDPTSVVDSRFRVHGTRNLRVVDASVFPRIPGSFIACAVYVIGQKASDVIVEDARA
jgi:choline dehydrogenase-like flavoprotein